MSLNTEICKISRCNHPPVGFGTTITHQIIWQTNPRVCPGCAAPQQERSWEANNNNCFSTGKISAGSQGSYLLINSSFSPRSEEFCGTLSPPLKSLHLLHPKLVLIGKMNPFEITLVVITTQSPGPHTYKEFVVSLSALLTRALFVLPRQQSCICQKGLKMAKPHFQKQGSTFIALYRPSEHEDMSRRGINNFVVEKATPMNRYSCGSF